MPVFNCVEKPLKRFYASYGRFIFHHPFIVLVTPIIVAGCLGPGIIFLEKESDTEYLFTPTNGRSVGERRQVEALFDQSNRNNQLPSRLTHFGRFGKSIIVAKNGLNILEEHSFFEVLRLHREILRIVVTDENEVEYDFSDICLKWQNECVDNEIFEVFNYSVSNNGKTQVITYPYWESTEENKVYFLGNSISGEVLDKNTSVIVNATAVQLQYFLVNDSESNGLSAIWEDKFLSVLEQFSSEVIDVTRFTSQSIEQELNKSSEEVFGMFTIAFALIINFAIWSCTKLDWVQNKPWLACLGVLSAGLSILSTFGLMGFCGLPFIDIVASTPILILSIGVDDMFIMICAWRKTNVRDTVEDRMAETLSEAALSITITSLTDALAFGVGAITFFPSVQIFCIFTGVAVLFDYFYQVTFFAAAMVLTGRREEANRHCTACNVVLPLDEAPSTAYKIFCAGGPSRKYETENENSAHAVMLFFQNYFASFICHNAVKTITIIIYLAYLAISLFGVTCIEEGLELRKIASDKSYVIPFYDYENLYFKKFGPPIAVVFNEEPAYWEPATQTKLENIVTQFEESQFTYGDAYTSWWLRDFLDYLDIVGISTPPKELFMKILQEEFLEVDLYKQYSLDIIINNNSNSITASRAYVLTREITNSTLETKMMNAMRDLADSMDENITVYNPLFIFTDQYNAVLPNTIQNISIALVSMFVVSIFLIPNPICALWVTFSILSIEVGVIGLMSFWGVNLDSVSMINLILCIGFSVDFSAHITYAFSIADGSNNKSRAKAAFYSLGMPIVQGAGSTIIGLFVLMSSDFYIFQTFFKTLFLTISLGCIHSLFVLPVFLMLCTQCSCDRSDSIPQVVPVSCRSLHVDILRTDRVSPTISSQNTIEMASKSGLDDLLVVCDDKKSSDIPEGKVNPTYEE